MTQGDDRRQDEKIEQERIEAAIIEGLKIITEGVGTPSDMWHPSYGWIKKHGKFTSLARKFYQDYLKLKEPKDGRT